MKTTQGYTGKIMIDIEAQEGLNEKRDYIKVREWVLINWTEEKKSKVYKSVENSQ